MREILLTQGQVALVDDEDYLRLAIFNWHAVRSGRTFYAVRNSPKPDNYLVFMHHEVLGRPELGFQVDHIDGAGFNNQKGNLRVVTISQNHRNRHYGVGASLFKGVSWDSRLNKWRSRIWLNNKNTHLGFFISEEVAARAYDAAALEHFGEFARLNFDG